MPSSPNTSCNFGDMQNTDYCLGIESIEHDESLVGPVLSVRGASPEAKKKGRRRARFYGPRGCFKNVVRVGVSCLCASASTCRTMWSRDGWFRVGCAMGASASVRVRCYVRQPGMLLGRVRNEGRFSSSGTVVLSPS